MGHRFHLCPPSLSFIASPTDILFRSLRARFLIDLRLSAPIYPGSHANITGMSPEKWQLRTPRVGFSGLTAAKRGVEPGEMATEDAQGRIQRAQTFSFTWILVKHQVRPMMIREKTKALMRPGTPAVRAGGHFVPRSCWTAYQMDGIV